MTAEFGGTPRARHAALRAPRAWIVLLLVLAAGLAVDLRSKDWAFDNVAGRPVPLDRERIVENPRYDPIPHHPSVTALPGGLLDFRLVINRGAVFGVGQGKRFFFIAFTAIALAVGLFVFARWTGPRHHLAHVAIAMILAGGIGNLYDRWRFGAVRDFLHMFPDWHLPFGWSWPYGSREIFPWVFNVADVLLLAGMGLLMIHLNRREHHRREREEREAAHRPAEPDLAEDEDPVDAPD